MLPFGRELLKESWSTDTIYEWVYRPTDGFLRYYGKLKQSLGIYGALTNAHKIPMYRNHNDSLVIRFPVVALLSTIGYSVGLYGCITFFRLYKRMEQTSLLYFIVSNLFFAGMNVSGFIYHCVLPIDHRKRYIFRYLDQVCTGVAGICMGNALRMIHTAINDRNIVLHSNKSIASLLKTGKWQTEKYKIGAVIGGCALLPMLHPALGDLIFLGGIVSSAYNVLQCHLKLREYEDEESDKELTNLKTMSKACLFVGGLTALAVLKQQHLEWWSNGAVNVMRTMFVFGDIGYMFNIYYGVKHYESKLVYG